MKKCLIIFFTAAVLTGCSVQEVDLVTTPDESANGNVSIDVGDIEILSDVRAVPKSFDFGEIDRAKGKVSTTVEISNTGKDIIKLYRLATSCGCTAAIIDMSDLSPRESRQMTITFDPMTHPDEVGPIIRVVYLQTSDPNLPELEIEITGNVI